MELVVSDRPSPVVMRLDPLMDVSEVEAATKLKKSRRAELIKDGLFPAPVKVSARRVAWRTSDIAAWIASRETKGVAA